MLDEENLRSRCKWANLGEVPDLPFKSFDELTESLKNGIYHLELSYPAARELAPVVRTSLGQIINLTLLLSPWLMIVLVLGATFWLGMYVILLGIPIALISHFFGNPMMPGHNFFRIVHLLAVVVFSFMLWHGYQTASWLLASAIFPFLSNVMMYRGNVAALDRATRRSEPLFLYLYEKGALRLRNTDTGKEYWNVGTSA